ncbi:hypothetical protein ES708_20142 [subsurface metagenome]
MRAGTASFGRECPVCGKLIEAGGPIALQRQLVKFQWIHRSCFRPGGMDRDVKRMDKEFAAITGEPYHNHHKGPRGPYPRSVKPVESGCRHHPDCFTCPFPDCIAANTEFIVTPAGAAAR